MGKVYDIMIDETGEDIARDGDDYVDESTRQHQQLLVICDKGENKMEPDSGVGISSWILDEQDGADLKREIQSEFEGDGQTIGFIKVESIDKISVAGSYGS